MKNAQTFEYVSSKLGKVDPETRSIAKELYDAAKARGHDIWFMWGMGSGKEHGSGNALDLMVRNEAAGDWVRNYIWANRLRLRLIHVIWEQHITSTRVSPGVRRKMKDRGSTTENHYDHNHVWFAPGPYNPPKPGTPTKTQVPKPPKAPVKTKVRTLYWNKKKQLTGLDVYRLQFGLRYHFPEFSKNLNPDGYFGPNTHKAVAEFQRRHKIGVSGQVGPQTRAALLKAGIRL